MCGYLRVPVDPWVPPPALCSICWEVGTHGRRACRRRSPKCGRYGDDRHKSWTVPRPSPPIRAAVTPTRPGTGTVEPGSSRGNSTAPTKARLTTSTAQSAGLWTPGGSSGRSSPRLRAVQLSGAPPQLPPLNRVVCFLPTDRNRQPAQTTVSLRPSSAKPH